MDIHYWLMKSEPLAFSIEDLQREGFTEWDGVRNYQVRNMMRDQMRVGDLAFIYHSNTKTPGIVGLCRICSEAKPDLSQWDPTSEYYDPKSPQDNPYWLMVEVEFVEKFSYLISLQTLKKQPQLSEMIILQKGNRLSITPLTHEQFTHICELAHESTSVSKDLINQRL